MKKFGLFIIVVFLITTASSFQEVKAQERTKEEQDKDAKMQKAIDQQKLEYSVQKAKEKLDSANKDREKSYMAMPRGNRSYNFNEPFIFTGQDINGLYVHGLGGDSERTSWDFSKTVKDNTFSGDYTFAVEKSSKSVIMSVMGDCKSGEIHIKIIMPNGKNYSDILIDESGNLNWRKSFTISETENQDKAGDWKFQISSTKATGFFKISLQTF